LMDAPTLLRVAGELVAVDAEGLLLTDGLGRRRSVTAARQSFAGELSEGPYSLINPDRTILALCA
ncbi:MAG: hypothetical protein VB036_14500, partial [Propionicimonas sp.]|nr:hypothetical protein [Propionicimonas sp.]